MIDYISTIDGSDDSRSRKGSKWERSEYKNTQEKKQADDTQNRGENEVSPISLFIIIPMSQILYKKQHSTSLTMFSLFSSEINVDNKH